jgi:hypothetical protein
MFIRRKRLSGLGFDLGLRLFRIRVEGFGFKVRGQSMGKDV